MGGVRRHLRPRRGSHDILGTSAEAAGRLIRSGAHLQALLDDLVDFNRSNLGLGINVVPSEVDLGAVCTEEMELLRAAYRLSLCNWMSWGTATDSGTADEYSRCWGIWLRMPSTMERPIRQCASRWTAG